MSAFHCLCAMCAQDDSDFCASLCSELATMSTASQVSLSSLRELLQRLRTDLDLAVAELQTHSAVYSAEPDGNGRDEEACAAKRRQPVNSGLLAGLPPLPLRDLHGQPLQVTYEQSDEEDSDDPDDQVCNSADDALNSEELGGHQRPLCSKEAGIIEGQASCGDKFERQCSPATSSTSSSRPSTARGSGAGCRLSRPQVPLLELAAAAELQHLSTALHAPRGTPRERILSGSRHRTSALSPIRRGTPELKSLTPRLMMSPTAFLPSSPLFQSIDTSEELLHSYLAGLPAPTPRRERVPLSARSATKSPPPLALPTLNHDCLAKKAGRDCPSRLTEAIIVAASSAQDIFPKNGSMLLDDSKAELCQNRTVRQGPPVSGSNGSCGLPVSLRRQAIHNDTAPCMPAELALGGEAFCRSSKRAQQSVRSRLQAMVARGKELLTLADQELAETDEIIRRCEKYFGGASSAQGTSEDSAGVALICTAAEVLSSFKQAWEEVHRDERCAVFLPGACSSRFPSSRLSSSRSEEASSARLRRFTPRRAAARA